MDAWFPDINAAGEIIAGGGVGEIWFSDPSGSWRQVGEGLRPKFIDAAWVVFAKTDQGSRLLNLRTGATRERKTGYTQYAAGGGRWAGLYQAVPTHLDLYQTVGHEVPSWSLRNGGKPALSRTGHFLYYDQFTSPSNRVIYDDQVIAIGPVVDLSVCDQGAVWTFATSTHGRKVMFWALMGNPIDISVQTEELLPVITEGPQGPWVVTGLTYGTLARRAGQTMGYFRRGDLLNPAAVWLDGFLHVVGSDEHGQPLTWIVDPAMPPVDLTAIRPGPVPVPPNPTKPTVKILSYPSLVVVGQGARCVAELSGGTADRLLWLERIVGETAWRTDATVTNLTPAITQVTYEYQFSAGDYEIAARVEGSGGTDQTGLQRVVHVVPASSSRSDRYWFGPNIASLDLAALATLQEQWPQAREQIGAFTLYAQHFHDDIPQTGVNTYAALKAAGLFTKLALDWKLPLNVEIGVVKDWDPDGTKNLAEIDYVLAKAHEAGVTVATFAMDEPMTGNTGAGHLPINEVADITARFIEKAEGLGVRTGWAEAWPHISITAQEAFLALLKTRTQLPRFWYLDIDRKRAQNEGKDVATFLRQAQQIGSQYGIVVGVYLVGYDHATDADYSLDVRAWARQVQGVLPDLRRVVVQSWARRNGGAQDIPANLPEGQPSSHTALVNAVVATFGGTAPPPTPVTYPPAKVYTV